MGLIFFLSSQPSLPGVPGLDRIDWGDKILHFSFYGVLGAFIWHGLGAGRPAWQRLLLTVALASLFGLSDEFHQRFVPNRSCDVLDLAADTLGALCAASVLSRIAAKRRKVIRIIPRNRA